MLGHRDNKLSVQTQFFNSNKKEYGQRTYVTVVHFLLVLVLLTQSCTYYAAKQMIIYERFFCFVSKYVTVRKIEMIRYMCYF